MKPLDPAHVRITDPFWSEWQNRMVEVTLPHQWRQLNETPRMANFRGVVAQGEKPRHVGRYFDDSDVYKWIEACSWAMLATPNHPGLKQLNIWVDEAIEAIRAAQEPDGYLNTYFQLNEADAKFTDLHAMHEMYCAGHLIEAAVVHKKATGKESLFQAAIRFANLLWEKFGPDGTPGYCGHEEIELALVMLSESSGDRRYRELAKLMIERRGHAPTLFSQEIEDPARCRLSPWSKTLFYRDGKYAGDYAQDHAPIREHTEVVGHAVRAMYLYIAATEVAPELEPGVDEAVLACWRSLTERRMYLTGGIGPNGDNEGFSFDYDLPNLTAYAETCAAIGLVLWGRRLLEHTGNAEFSDIMERALYNGVLSGVSLSGDQFFYDNPLESRGKNERVPWFSCACCPPNLARLIGQISQLAVGASEEALWLHLPIGLSASVEVAGTKVEMEVSSGMPWTGDVTVRIRCAKPTRFALRVRIPDWCEDVSAEMEGAEEAEYDSGYMIFDRVWDDCTLRLDMEMLPHWVESNPRVVENAGRAAMMRGPLVYALEEVDLGGPPQLFSVDWSDEPTSIWRKELLGGVTVVTISGELIRDSFGDALYEEVGGLAADEKAVQMIPYYAWGNRGKGHMQVWLRKMV